MIFTEGNHLMVLLSDDISAHSDVGKSQSQFCDLDLDNIMAVTLPQPISSFRWCALEESRWAISPSSAESLGFYDIVMGGPDPRKICASWSARAAGTFLFRIAASRFVQKAISCYSGLSDIARAGAHLHSDVVEAGSRARTRRGRRLIGKSAADAFFAMEVRHFPGRLRCTHRDVSGWLPVAMPTWHDAVSSYYLLDAGISNHFSWCPSRAERFVKIAFGRVVDRFAALPSIRGVLLQPGRHLSSI